MNSENDISPGNTSILNHSSNDDVHAIGNMHKIASIDGLDRKQKKAFFIMCTSFIYQIIMKQDENLQNDVIRSLASNYTTFPNEVQDRATLLSYLKTTYGAKDQLLMVLTGKGGSGKSFILNSFYKYVKEIYQLCALPFDSSVIRITSMTGCSAASLGGKTTHHEIKLNSKTPIKHCPTWCHTIFIIIDEISFLDVDTLTKIDKHLRILTNQREKLYGGLNIIFSGDLWQLPPVSKANKSLYASPSSLWEQINSVVFLESNHRFRSDPEWGRILERIRCHSFTENDIETINKHILCDTNKLQDNNHYWYACPYNKTRNSISKAIFKRILEKNHSKDINILAPDTAVMILSNLYDHSTGQSIRSQVQNFIYKNCGDANVKNQTKLIDPALCLYSGCPVMLSHNEDLNESGYANGTLCLFLGIKLVEGSIKVPIPYDGYYVYSVYAKDLDYILVCKWNDKNLEASRRRPLKVYPRKQQAVISIKDYPKLKVKIQQVPLLSADAITGHKLQGMTMNNLVIQDFDYKTPNWVYVALSRVKDRKGLFLMSKLDKNKIKKPNDGLVLMEERLKEKEHVISL